MAETEQVKGVQFNYVNFLWREIGIARDQQNMGNHRGALRLLITLVPYLPKGIKDQFRLKAAKIMEKMRKIESNVQGSTFLMRRIARNREATLYAKRVFEEFVDELSSALDKRGYMEKTRKKLPEGFSHTWER